MTFLFHEISACVNAFESLLRRFPSEVVRRMYDLEEYYVLDYLSKDYRSPNRCIGLKSNVSFDIHWF